MSIQVGTWNFDGQPANERLLARISEDLAEYGPDGEARYVHQSVGMLYRALHITSESQLELQPRHLRGGEVMTWDGRLDNRDELIALFQPELRNDLTDLAIVAAAFECWGTSSFAKLIGDWALVVWDPHGRELILAKDYMGTRNLFYYPRSSNITWCTHLAPLALCGDKFTLCDEYIAGYLAFHPDAGLTPYHEIRSVPPASFVSVKNAKPTVHFYWQLNRQHKTRYKTDEEYEEHYRLLLRQAVRRRLRSCTPILAELSGGLDSSSIVLIADDILVKEQANKTSLATFSYHDSSEPEDSDLAYFTNLEHQRGSSGYHLDLAGSGDSLSFDYPVFVARPGFGSRTEVTAPLQDLIGNSGYRVVLSGLGGDEMNGQALNLCVPVADMLSRLQVARASKELVSWSLSTGRPWIQLFLKSIAEILPGPLRIRSAARRNALNWIEPSFAKRYQIASRQLLAVKEPWLRRPNTRDWTQTITSVRNVVAHGRPSIVERRCPYLDRTLVEFLVSIPLDQLLRPGHRRSLMRRALRDVLPQELLSRTTKGTAVRCFCVTLEKHWKKIEGVLVSPLASHLGYIKRDKLRAALLAMRNGLVPANSVALLRALSLEFWLRDAAARGIVSVPTTLLPTSKTIEIEELSA